MIELKKHGSYLELDSNGFVQSKSHIDFIQDKWSPLVEETVEFYRSKFGENLHSVYVRGSVAKGEGLDGISDLDTFCILHEGPGEVESPFSEDFQNEMNAKYPFCTHVEISFLERAKIHKPFPPRERSVWAELIKTQSACVYGEDLAQEIAPFKLSNMKGHSYFIEQELKELPKYYEEDQDSVEDLLDLCVWITRRVIRSGYDLVMEREGKFTRDLYLCWESFSKYYPEKSDDMKVVLNLALNPLPDKAVVMQALDKITPVILSDTNIFMNESLKRGS